jgi:RNA polymerase sigma-70 factor (ECF subfamily)
MPRTKPLVADEQALIRRLAQGDESAMEDLLKALERPVFSLVYAVVRDRQAAEDVCSEAFLKVWRGAKSYDPSKGRLASWVFSIARNRAIDHLRARKARRAVGLSPEGDLAAVERAGLRPAATPWQSDQVRRALKGLSEIQRQAVLMAYFEGLSREAMAQRLGVPLGTVKTRLREALLKLKKLYDDPEPLFKALAKDGPHA